MKISILLILILGIYQKPSEQADAKVQSIQGVNIYIYSEPTQEFEILETGSVKLTLTGSCEEQIKQAATKAAKIKADGIIISLGSPTRWSAIKFKE